MITNFVTGSPGHTQPQFRPSPGVSTRVTRWLTRHWFGAFLIIWGMYVLLPFAAPLMMKMGWTGVGRAIYFLYSFLCHQLPERSFFLFGNQFTYSLADIQAAWQNTTDFALLRKFIGNPEMGWKLAWSDRMVSLYTSIWIWAVLWYPIRRKIHRLRWWGALLLMLPMVLDGTSHLVSDLAGLGVGFRDTNAWLASLSGFSLPANFIQGDTWGSFNSWMRMISGTAFGLGIVWFGFPYLEEAFTGLNYGRMEKIA